MPRVSSAVKDAVEVSLGIQEGWIEVTKAVCRSHQYPPNKNTGKQGDPFPCVQLTVVRTDEKGVRLDDETEETLELGIGGVSRSDPSQWKFHPGKAASSDDEDPEDLGIEVDTEGNCIFAAEEGAHLNKKSKWMRFCASLEEKGFKPEVLAASYMPDLVGLKGFLKTLTLDKAADADKDAKNPTAYVMEKIIQFPYEAKKKAAAGKSYKPAAAKSQTQTQTQQKSEAPAKQEASADDAESMAVTHLSAVLTTLAKAEESVEVERKKVQTQVQTRLMRERVSPKLHKPIMDMVKDAEWLEKQAGEGPLEGKFSVDGDNLILAAAE